MKPINQTKFGNRKGNCFDACLASIMELPIEIFPNFKEFDWLNRYNQFLQDKFGLQLLLVTVGPYDLFGKSGGMLNTYHVISGPGPRGLNHSAVGLNGKIVHDPHPDKTGLKEAQLWDFLIKTFR